MATLEVCIDNIAGLNACIEATPDRVELCSALELGGLTPSAGLMKLAGRTSLSVFAMIRPRTGNFNFDDNEVQIMCNDIQVAMDAGLAGVVLGVTNTNSNATLNTGALEKLVAVAGPLNKTLHRVIDVVDNPLEAMEQAIDLGFDHILSSGGEASVKKGAPLLSSLQEQAAGRITIMAGAGLTPSLVQPIYQQTGVTSFHSSCSCFENATMKQETLGFTNANMRKTSADIIWQYKTALNQISAH